VVAFKRDVYRGALNQLAPLLGLQPREPAPSAPAAPASAGP
jgi:hypothetical protein